jgi:hypothetical protein
MANRYSVLLEFLENSNSHLVFKLKVKSNLLQLPSYLITTASVHAKWWLNLKIKANFIQKTENIVFKKSNILLSGYIQI